MNATIISPLGQGVGMIDVIRDKVKELLDSGEIKGFLGLVRKNGHLAPHLFQKGDDLGAMSLGDDKVAGDARYPLNKFLINLAKAYPEETFAVLVRGCDDRGLQTLYTWNQLNPKKVVPVGITCPQELADAARLDTWLIATAQRERTVLVPKNLARQFGPLRDGERLDRAIKELDALDRLRVNKEGRRLLLALNPAILAEENSHG